MRKLLLLLGALLLASTGLAQGPITYSARTDMCVTSSDFINGSSGALCGSLQLSFQGRNSFTGGTYVALDTAPNMGGLVGANTCITDPDFGSKICRVTDYNLSSITTGRNFHIGDAGVTNRWSVDSTKFFVDWTGGSSIIYAFSADSNMTSTPSGIFGVTGTACSANCTQFMNNSSITMSASNPNVIWEVVQTTAQLNKLTITNPNAAPSAWVFSRTPIFNFFTDGTLCKLPADFVPNAVGIFATSDSDTSITLEFSDNGQGVPGVPAGRYGPVFLVNWTQGQPGCRMFNPFTGTITGDWGDNGAPTDGTGTCTVGVTCGNPLPDRWYMHEGSSWSDGRIGLSSPPSSLSNPPGQCGGDICGTYYWEIATRNVRACQVGGQTSSCSGHSAKGFLYDYRGKHYTTHSPFNPPLPNIQLISQTIPVDDHGTYNNGDVNDQQPPFFATTRVCDNNGAVGGNPTNPCDGSYALCGLSNCAHYNEIIAAENSVANATAHHCDYGGGPNTAGCVYRFAHNFNTGSSWAFQTANAIGNVSQDGRFVLFASDWNRTLGCTNGWDGVTAGQKCLDPVSADSSASVTITQVAVDGSNNTTITASNAYSVGMSVKISGLTGATFLNGKSLFITSVTPTSFTGTGVTHAAYGPAADNGTANWAGCGTGLSGIACSRGDVFVVSLLSTSPSISPTQLFGHIKIQGNLVIK